MNAYPHRGECPCGHGTLLHGVSGCWACVCQMCWMLGTLVRREDRITGYRLRVNMKWLETIRARHQDGTRLHS